MGGASSSECAAGGGGLAGAGRGGYGGNDGGGSCSATSGSCSGLPSRRGQGAPTRNIGGTEYKLLDLNMLAAGCWEAVKHGPPVDVYGGLGVAQVAFHRRKKSGNGYEYAVRKVNPFKPVDASRADYFIVDECATHNLNLAITRINANQSVTLMNNDASEKKMQWKEWLNSQDPEVCKATKLLIRDYPKKSLNFFTVRQTASGATAGGEEEVEEEEEEEEVESQIASYVVRNPMMDMLSSRTIGAHHVAPSHAERLEDSRYLTSYFSQKENAHMVGGIIYRALSEQVHNENVGPIYAF
jgi:hypothetical protein